TGAFRVVDTFQLGPATIKDTDFAELDLGSIGDLFGIKLAGIVGFDFFRRTVIDIDLDAPTIAIHDPASFTLGSGEWTPLKFSSGNPVVEATLEGDRKGWFRLDTGANGTVVFHSPFVLEHKLLDNRETTTSGSMGVGGVSATKTGTIEWFELSGHRFANPTVSFSQATVGAFANKHLAGNIGQEFMKPFTIVFDFGGSRVGLIPKKS
ncbi:MAG: hypothetical protein QOJ65_2011, partial [Fimbriimonadaceae bacterium]|nr:hypothetical protein [Fimbriimonadaceae bacterium]